MDTRIVVVDGMPLNPGDLSWEPLRALGSVEIHHSSAPETLVERCADATVIMTNKVRLDRATLTALPSVRLIVVTATGFDMVDTDAASEMGMTVCNVPGYSTRSTAQLTIALLLELSHNVGEHARSVREGGWLRNGTFSYWLSSQHELDGRSLCIIGKGAIGERVGDIAAALGMRVTYASLPDRERPDRVPFSEALAEASTVSLHCPLNDSTRGLFSAEVLRAMRPGAWLINTARGALVDEAAVASSLRSGHLGAYAADVLSVEPPPSAHPLLDAPRCLLTPHLGWVTYESRARLLDEAVRNVADFIDGRPRNVVVG